MSEDIIRYHNLTTSIKFVHGLAVFESIKISRYKCAKKECMKAYYIKAVNAEHQREKLFFSFMNPKHSGSKL
jgi:hypothetical protein